MSKERLNGGNPHGTEQYREVVYPNDLLGRMQFVELTDAPDILSITPEALLAEGQRRFQESPLSKDVVASDDTGWGVQF